MSLGTGNFEGERESIKIAGEKRSRTMRNYADAGGSFFYSVGPFEFSERRSG